MQSLRFAHPEAPHFESLRRGLYREGERLESWRTAVWLVELCPNLETFRWETGLGINSELWTVSLLIWTVCGAHPGLFQG